MNNPYLCLQPKELAGVWGMRAAELMPQGDTDDGASVARDTAYMLLAGAMRVARADAQHALRDPRTDALATSALRQRQIRFEVIKRAAYVALPEHPERWLMEADATGLANFQRALESDDGLCEVLRHLQQIAFIGGRWHAASGTPNA